jgi:signal peptidase II
MKIDKKYLILLSLSGFIIALDQATKLYVHSHFYLGESITVINDLFNLTYVRNKGAAFGMLGDSNESFREIFFLTMPPIALVIVLRILKDVASTDRLQVLALSSIFAGAIGNYIDRIRFRYVIDFLDFHIARKYTWPAFNVADSAIVIGVMVLFYILFRDWKLEKQQAKAAESAS